MIMRIGLLKTGISANEMREGRPVEALLLQQVPRGRKTAA